MTSQLHPTRFFEATTATLNYILDEGHAEGYEAEAIEETLRIVAETEGDVFEERSCPDCVEVFHGIDDRDASNRLNDHQAATHQ